MLAISMGTRIVRFITLSLAALCVASCFACASGPGPIPDRKLHAPAQTRAAVEKMMGLSVAILIAEPSISEVLEGVPLNGATCTGTWVGPDEILTAFHCVIGATASESDSYTRPRDAYMGDIDLRGLKVRYALASDVDDDEEDMRSITASHVAVIDRVAPDDDLAILKTTDVFTTNWAQITDRPLEMGERFQGIVMSGAFPFSYGEGYVTRPRRTIIINYHSGNKTTAFQSASDMWRGSSGSCVFDDEMKCMGVFVATAHGSNSMGFIIHHARVRPLLMARAKKTVIPTAPPKH